MVVFYLPNVQEDGVERVMINLLIAHIKKYPSLYVVILLLG